MADVVLDANVLVALLYEGDNHHERAHALFDRIDADDHSIVLFDFLMQEAVSVLCRRARERKSSPPNLGRTLKSVRTWIREGYVHFMARETEHVTSDVLDVIEATGGALNFNDALIVVLDREGMIDHFASFDPGFDAFPELRRFPG